MQLKHKKLNGITQSILEPVLKLQLTNSSTVLEILDYDYSMGIQTGDKSGIQYSNNILLSQGRDNGCYFCLQLIFCSRNQKLRDK